MPHFSWTGKGLRKSSVADWQRAIRRLFEIAQVTGHPHMFHTRSQRIRCREEFRSLRQELRNRIQQAYQWDVLDKPIPRTYGPVK